MWGSHGFRDEGPTTYRTTKTVILAAFSICNEILWQLSTRYSIFTKISQFSARWIWHTTPLQYSSYYVGWPHQSRSSEGHTWKTWLGRFCYLCRHKNLNSWQSSCFLRIRNLFLTLFLCCHIWVTSKIQVNFRYRGYLKVLMIVSDEFLKFLQYLCFWGRCIHFWYSY